MYNILTIFDFRIILEAKDVTIVAMVVFCVAVVLLVRRCESKFNM